MEPRHRAAETLTRLDQLRFRLRVVAACAVLVGLSMVQSPGLLSADTKFDLAVDPGRFLLRATHLWDPVGAFGQLQNQAYGYLWPMGPFFLLGDLVDLPGWVVQRLWLALVLCVAMVGAARLARGLGVRSDLACLVAGFAYALSPRMLTTLGPISIEAWPSAVAPWVLLPLIVGSERGSPRRAALMSALAVAMVGGVNAAATFAVLPLGALWLLTRGPGPRRRALMLWWPVFTVLATAWWLVPLLVMGSYSPPFLDYIESASNTTFPTTLFDALRGTSDWVAYIDTSWRAGNDLLRLPALVINSGVLLMFGLVGLMLRRTPHRLFLALGVLTGLVMVTAGHRGSVEGWASADLRVLLDGALAPFRNVHKFDLVLRLPLVLGLAWMIDALVAQLRDQRATPVADRSRVAQLVSRVNVSVLIGATVVAVFGASLPAFAGRIAPAGAISGVPGYWAQTAHWLSDQPGTALLVPGSSFGSYVWGTPRDEPLQALAEHRWAVRNAVPLAPPGNIRMLDAIERRLGQGAGSPGLAAYLRRAGVSHLVVRNDLSRSGDVPDPVLVHQAIAGTPGLVRVATFGPDIGGQGHLKGKVGRVLINGGWQNEYPAIEIFAVPGAEPFAVGSNTLPVVVGGSEDLLDLADLGVLDDEPTQLAADVHGQPDPAAPLVLTDGLRAVEQHFGRVHDGASATLAPGDPRRMGNRSRDYLPQGANRWSTWARYDGADGVTASSSMSDANAVGAAQPGEQPYSAVDGDPGTSWVANRQSGGAAWWRVDFSPGTTVSAVTVTAGPLDREIVRVRTPGQVSPAISLQPGGSRTVELRTSAARWLRIEDASGRAGHQLALAEVRVPGVQIKRSLVLPRLPKDWGDPDQIVVRAVSDARTGCVAVDSAIRCVPDRTVAGEEPGGFRRIVTLNSSKSYGAALDVRVRPGDALVSELLRDLPVGISASTTANPDLRGSVLAAVDGDPGTTWTAAPSDLRPTVRMNWLGRRTISGLDISVAADTAARLPEQLELQWPGGKRKVTVPPGGAVRLTPFRTDQLTIRVAEARPATSLGFDSQASSVPVGISELRLRGLPYLPVALPSKEYRWPCGSGPTLGVNGVPVLSSVTASPASLYEKGMAPARLCGTSSIRLDGGANRVELYASTLFTPASLLLRGPDIHPVSTTALTVEQPSPVRREILADPTSHVVSLKENTNPGWQAFQGDHHLEPVVVDGWQQGWRVRTPGTRIDIGFGPDRLYRAGLLAGLGLVLLLVVLLAATRRRWGSRQAPLRPAQVPAAVMVAISCVGGGLLAGWVGAAIVLISYATALVATRWRPDAAPWLLASVVLGPTAAYAVDPWGSSNGWAGSLAWPHYLVVVALGFLLGSLPTVPWRFPRDLRRMPGSSTRR